MRLPHLLDILIAALGVLLCLGLSHTDIVESFELRAFDRFMQEKVKRNPCPAVAPVTIVQIDNNSLDRYGRWPWPRSQQAALVKALANLGAKLVLLDIEYPEPMPQERAAEDEALAGAIRDAHRDGCPVFGMAYFRGSLASSPGSIEESTIEDILARRTVIAPSPAGSPPERPRDGHGETLDLARDPARLVNAIADLLAEVSTAKAIDLLEDRKRIGDLALPEVSERDLENFKLDRLLKAGLIVAHAHPGAGESDFTTGVAECLWGDPSHHVKEGLAQRALPAIHRFLGEHLPAIDQLDTTIDLVRESMVRRSVARTLASSPAAADAQIVDAALQQLDVPRVGFERAAQRALTLLRSQGIVSARDIFPLSGGDALPSDGVLQPPIPSVAKEYCAVGASTISRDIDGKLRWARLARRLEESPARQPPDLIFQGALPALAHLLKLDLPRARFTAGHEFVLPMRDGSPSIVVPCDARGGMLVNWTGEWSQESDGFLRVSAGALLEIEALAASREAELENLTSVAPKQTTEVTEVKAKEVSEYWICTQALAAARARAQAGTGSVESLEELIGPALASKLDAPGRLSVGEWVRQLEQQVDDLERHAERNFAKNLAREPSVVELRRLRRDPATDRAQMRRELGEMRANGDRFEKYFIFLPEMRHVLERLVRGRACLVGLTATGTTDFSPNPLQALYPNLGLHAHVMNTIMSRQFLVRLAWVAPVSMTVIAAVLAVGLPNLSILGGALFWALLLVLQILGALYSLVYRNWVIAVVSPVVASFFVFIGITLRRYFAEERQKSKIQKTFEGYLDPKLVNSLVENRDLWASISGTTREITAFFSDVQGFTSISEALTVDELGDALTAYLDAMTNVIVKHDGMREKYIGDAIAAFFGAPMPYTDHAVKACYAALDQQQELAAMRARWETEHAGWYAKIIARGLEMKVRIGLNTGMTKVGNFGSKGSQYYSMVGDTVNLASRLEGSNKKFGTFIMISETTERQARDKIETREVDRIRVKGKDIPVAIYELMGRKGSLDQARSSLQSQFAEALALYRQKRWDEARAAFEAIARDFPQDGPTKEYLHRLGDEAWMKGLPEPWDGAYTMTEK